MDREPESGSGAGTACPGNDHSDEGAGSKWTTDGRARAPGENRAVERRQPRDGAEALSTGRVAPGHGIRVWAVSQKAVTRATQASRSSGWQDSTTWWTYRVGIETQPAGAPSPESPSSRVSVPPLTITSS